MRMNRMVLTMAMVLAAVMFMGVTASAKQKKENYKAVKYEKNEKKLQNHGHSVQLGPRPYFLVNDMDESKLKEELMKCSEGPFKRTDFSIGHRGASLQFAEHTKESYMAAARMGAGIIECDVTFTKDRELVCRHSQCDLHTTTNILAIPELAEKCTVPFEPAVINSDGETITEAKAKCCTSDITLDEFRMLNGKMDASNPNATTVEEYMDATANYRTDLYAEHGTLMTHAESIELFKSLSVKMTPELKSPGVEMPYQGDYTQEAYAQQMINEYKDAGVSPKKVFAQSFNLKDVLYWLHNEPDFGKQGVYLDGRYGVSGFDHTDPSTWPQTMEELVQQGVRIIAPPMYFLVALDGNDKIVPSIYAKKAKKAGLEIITWTLERSGFLSSGGGFYYQSIPSVINNDGDMLNVLDVLAQDVGVLGVFSDWPATVTYYSNCKGMK
ncbi:MAG: glycerophosphodiester phosphodiesterase family protein [Desulfuromusa sp.]|nr:glycerophosphodiester phosphodiesterase family protein [Desulfuromusa sp.]